MDAEQKSSMSWQTPALVVLGLIAISALAFGWNATAKLSGTQNTVAEQIQSVKQTVDQDVAGLKVRLQQSEKTNAELQADLKVVTKKLRLTEGQLKSAREESSKKLDETAQKLTELDSSVKSEIKATNEGLKGVDTRVVGVRTDLDATREELKMARSELGTLIARNHDEIDSLRRLGEREYIEFTIAGKNKPQRVGNVTVELRGVNPSRNQFTVALIVGDKRFEKKNRAVNEPIFFYTAGTRLPQELVINKVDKNQISGYVSVPKANLQQQTPVASSNSSSGR